MRFEHREMLWLVGVTVPLLAIFLAWSWRKRKWLISQFVQSRLLAHLTLGVSPARQMVRMTLQISAVGLVLVAMARPQWGLSWEETRPHGLDILVAIDTSRSMLAQDVPPNRLARAKLAAQDLARLARKDRLGLIAFAGTAFLQSPLTLDENAFHENLDSLQVGLLPQGGTAISSALATAIETFRQEGSPYKVLVIFSDGEDHEPGATELAKKAAEAGVRIFTIGCGTANGDLLKEQQENGSWSYIKDADGNVVKSRLNEALLAEIAGVAQGFYLPLRGGQTMDVLYQRGLAPLPRADLPARFFRQYNERFQWPLGLAVLFLLVELFLPDRKPAKRTEAALVAPEGSFQQIVRAKSAVVWLAFSLVWSAQASPRTALRDYEEGHYKAAQREYEHLLENKPTDARLRFNAGVAAYQAGNYADAARHFHATLASPDLQLQEQAYYNLGNALFRLGQNQNDPNKTIPFWEQSVEQFGNALGLNERDRDSAFNRGLVQQKLEELKKKNPPPPPKQDNQQQNKKSEKQKEDQPENKPDKPQEKKPNPAPDSQKSQSGPSKQNQPPQSDQEKKSPAKSSQQPPKESKSENKTDTPEPGQGAAALPTGQMTPQQAKQLLESQREDEKPFPFVPAQKETPAKKPLKDW